MVDYRLTPKQKEAADQLRAALRACERNHVLLWNDYGNLKAVNGRVVKRISPQEVAGCQPVDTGMVYRIGEIDCGNSDDPCFVEFM